MPPFQISVRGGISLFQNEFIFCYLSSNPFSLGWDVCCFLKISLYKSFYIFKKSCRCRRSLNKVCSCFFFKKMPKKLDFLGYLQKELPCLSQAMVVGDRRKFLSCILVRLKSISFKTFLKKPFFLSKRALLRPSSPRWTPPRSSPPTSWSRRRCSGARLPGARCIYDGPVFLLVSLFS